MCDEGGEVAWHKVTPPPSLCLLPLVLNPWLLGSPAPTFPHASISVPRGVRKSKFVANNWFHLVSFQARKQPKPLPVIFHFRGVVLMASAGKGHWFLGLLFFYGTPVGPVCHRVFFLIAFPLGTSFSSHGRLLHDKRSDFASAKIQGAFFFSFLWGPKWAIKY